jgi:hypothetical protein
MINLNNGGDATVENEENETQLEEVVCFDLDVELIRKQLLSEELKEEFIQKN